MGWIVGWCVFMGVSAYRFGGQDIGAAIISFGFWFLILAAARVLIFNAQAKRQPREAKPKIPEAKAERPMNRPLIQSPEKSQYQVGIRHR